MNQFLVFLFITSLIATCTSAVAQSATAKCTLKEPVYNATFDLSGMKTSKAHLLTVPGKGEYNFNMCDGTIAKTCNGTANAGACFKAVGTGQEHILGYASATPQMRHSTISFDYVGEKCAEDPTKNYTLTVIAECDYNIEVDPITPITSTACDHILRYRSTEACMQTAAKHLCQFELPGNGSAKSTVDLVQMSWNNQHVKTNGSMTTTFTVSVCRPVIYTAMSQCPPDTNICMYNKKTQKFTAIGGPVVSLEPTETDQLSLRYSSGTKCKQNAALNVSTIIQLKCNSKQLSKISYVRQSNCTHFFEWPTPVACLTQPPSCTAYDAHNNFNFDLRPLKNRSYNVSRDGRTYNFGVCQSPKTCGNGDVGSCTERGIVLGKVNDALTYDAATGAPPFLMYAGGAKCSTKDGDGFTKIEFVCPATDRDDDKAELVDDKDCMIVIRFATQLACPQKILCKDTFKGVDYDLTPLINGQANYEAELGEGLRNSSSLKGSKFYLNVCRPLVSQYGLNCHHRSAVCRANMGKDGSTVENATSLGLPDASLTVVDNSSESSSRQQPTPQLKYLRGGKCPGQSTKTGVEQEEEEEASTIVNFKCNPKAGRGRPMLTAVEDECHYTFEWETNVICKDAVAEYAACAVKNAETGGVFNLSSLSALPVVKGVKIDMCRLAEWETEVDYGSQLVYLRANKTDVQEASVELVLECRGNVTMQRAELNEKGSPFNYTINYINAEVCPLFGEPSSAAAESANPSVTTEKSAATTTTTNKSAAGATTTTVASVAPANNSSKTEATTLAPDSSARTKTAKAEEKGAAAGVDASSPPPPARSGMSAWGITGVIFLLCSVSVLIGLVLRSPHRRAQVMSLFRRKNVAVSYTRVFHEEASLLMAPAGLSESDDELLV